MPDNTTRTSDGGKPPLLSPDVKRRLVILAFGTVLITGALASAPRLQRDATGVLTPPPAGGAPARVEIVETQRIGKVVAWTDPGGKFMLFLSTRNRPVTLRIERHGCGTHTATEVRFRVPETTTIPVPPCPAAVAGTER